VLAAQRGARVSGLDASDALVAIARERVPLGDFRVGDLEALPHDAQTFDAVIACLSVQYAADPLAALRELRRVCVPGGLFAMSTWGLPEQCEQRIIFQTVRETLPSPPAGGGPFALSAPGALEDLVEQAGWRVVGNGVADCPFEYPDMETLWRAQRSGGPIQGALRAVREHRLRAALEQAVRPYQTRAGGVRLENRLRFVIATD
jgi:SAM-dependent methyltransferase